MKARILVIDDDAIVLEGFRKTLQNDTDASSQALDALGASLFGTETPVRTERPTFEVDLVRDGEQGCRSAAEARSAARPYAVAFVDMRMPGGWDGLQTIEALWRTDPHIQVVICTAYSDYSWADMIARLGRSDRLLILRKPFETIEVLQLACALSEKWAMHRERQAQLDELERRVEERTQRLQQALDEGKAYEVELHHQATHDGLTGLPNRHLLGDRAAQCLAQAKEAGQRVAMLFLDLDRFKLVNDSCGHGLGDALLEAVALRLQTTVRDSDTVARFGGDEFVIMLPALVQLADAGNVAQKVVAAFAKPFVVGGQELHVTASVGLSIYPEDGDNGETLLKHADAAMYRAKEQGGNGLQFYAREMGALAEERNALQNALRGALERQEFELHYQPQVDLVSGRIRAVEALIRWHRPGVGLVAPDRFISLAEETGLIVPIGEWVLRTACAQAALWHAAGHHHLTMAVNLSARQFRQKHLVGMIEQVLRETGLAPTLLELELTEGMLMHQAEDTVYTLARLDEMGVRLAIDDFGTGYSSLSYLKRFPIHTLKIDRSFVQDIGTDPDDAAIVTAIVAMARGLSLSVTAEGVETEQQAAFLRSLSCDLAQGYHFGRPLPETDFAARLAAAPAVHARRDGERRSGLMVPAVGAAG
jgi:diguanylate cyclase (GGDEF)-like protein